MGAMARAAGFPAINAVAMSNHLWIGLRLVAHRTAKASALESRHDMVLPVGAAPSRARGLWSDRLDGEMPKTAYNQLT